MPKPRLRYTVDEYLALERAAPERHIYVDGEIFAMAGESDAHGVITFNLTGLFYNGLRGKSCQARIKDTKVRTGILSLSGRATAGMFSYPDILVICGEVEFHDNHKDIILNPTAIIEVLSPSTELFDRGEKFRRYQIWNPTLTDYVLVSQVRPQIEHFSKDAAGKWTFARHEGLDAIVVIASIQCTLRLAEVYERVNFPVLDENATEPPG